MYVVAMTPARVPMRVVAAMAAMTGVVGATVLVVARESGGSSNNNGDNEGVSEAAAAEISNRSKSHSVESYDRQNSGSGISG